MQNRTKVRFFPEAQKPDSGIAVASHSSSDLLKWIQRIEVVDVTSNYWTELSWIIDMIEEGVKSASICLASKLLFPPHFVLYYRLKDQLMPPILKKKRDGDLACITNKNIQVLPKKML